MTKNWRKETIQKINKYKLDLILRQAQRGEEVAATLSASMIFVNKIGDELIDISGRKIELKNDELNDYDGKCEGKLERNKKGMPSEKELFVYDSKERTFSKIKNIIS